jgi:hypothetical protein
MVFLFTTHCHYFLFIFLIITTIVLTSGLVSIDVSRHHPLARPKECEKANETHDGIVAKESEKFM